MSGNNKRGFLLQDRDERLLRELGVMRIIDREQAKCIGGFGSITRVNARLLGLTRVGLLRRFFIGTDARGMKALYTLTREGERLSGGAQPGLRRRENEVLVADRFVHHQLHINDIHCLLKYGPIPIPDTRFLRWVSFRGPIDSRRSLIPDGYVEIAERERVLAAFLEIDLGSEAPSVWRKKVQEYLSYAMGGDAPREFGSAQFRVLAVTNSPERMNSLRAATAALTEKIFWFTTFDSIERDGFWSAIWQRSSDGKGRALIELQE
jgi:Replication-relaxation